MKWTLTGVFGVLVVWSLVAMTLKPSQSGDGRTPLFFVTDNNIVRYEMIDRFNAKHPDLDLRLDPNNTGIGKIVVQSLGGCGPDVFSVFGRWQLVDFVGMNVLMELDEYAEEYGITPDKTWASAHDEMCTKTFNPDTGQYEEHQYTFPANVTANVMFYNKRLFREAGVAYPTDSWTWDECMDKLREVVGYHRVRGDKLWGINTYQYSDTTELIWQYGGGFYDETLTYCTVDSAKSLEAMKALHRMLAVDDTMPTIAELTDEQVKGSSGGNAIHLFGEERLVMLPIGRWALVRLREYEITRNGDLGVVQLPSQGEPVVLCRAMSLGINPNGKNIEQSLKVLKFLTSPEYNDLIIETADGLPPMPEYSQSDKFLHDSAYPAEDFNEAFNIAMDRGRNIRICPFAPTYEVEMEFNSRVAAFGSPNKDLVEEATRYTKFVNDTIRVNLSRHRSMREEYKLRTGQEFDPNNFPPKD